LNSEESQPTYTERTKNTHNQLKSQRKTNNSKMLLILHLKAKIKKLLKTYSNSLLKEEIKNISHVPYTLAMNSLDLMLFWNMLGDSV